MNILLTNDDGINSKSFDVLYRICKDYGYKNVQVLAPKDDKSGVGHSITLNNALELQMFSNDRFCIDGTPVDCVVTASSNCIPNIKKPDFIISGINIGANIGLDSLYSGTIAAAVQANLCGIRSFAISQLYKNKHNFFFNTDNNIFLELFNILIQYANDFEDCIVNVNLPCQKIKGVKFISCGQHRFSSNRVEYDNKKSLTIKYDCVNIPKELEEGYILINLVSCNREAIYNEHNDLLINKIISNF